MKTKKRRAKPVTLLTKIETLLSEVLQECSEIEKSIEKNIPLLLRSAEGAVIAAKDYFTVREQTKVRKARPAGPVAGRRVVRRVKPATVKKHAA